MLEYIISVVLLVKKKSKSFGDLRDPYYFIENEYNKWPLSKESEYFFIHCNRNDNTMSDFVFSEKTYGIETDKEIDTEIILEIWENRWVW